MNPLMLIPLMAMSCAAAPHVVLPLHGAALPYAHALHGAALPYAHAGVVATHSVTHNVPSAVEYKQVGDVVALGHPLVHAAVPGYTVGGEIRTVSDVDALPLVAHAGAYAHHGLSHAGVYAHHGLAHAGVYAHHGLAHAGFYAHHGLIHAPLAVAPAVVNAEDAEEEVKTVSIHTIPSAYTAGHVLGAPHLGLGLGYHGLGLGYHGLGLGYHGLPLVAAAAEEPAAEVAEE